MGEAMGSGLEIYVYRAVIYPRNTQETQGHLTYSSLTTPPCGSNFHATKSRIIAPGIPRHVTQCGKARQQLNNDIQPGRQLRVT